MITIGLLGGVASGKSFVAETFRDLGAFVLDADRVGHEVLRRPNVVAQLVERWGPPILRSDGRVDRSAVAARVFGKSDEFRQELAFLERVTHPEIEGELRVQLADCRHRGHHRVAVLDAAVMLKAGWDRLCDRLLFVDAPSAVRLERARRRGLSDQDFHAREASQASLAEKKRRADLVLDNGGSLENTRRQVEEVWHSLPEMS